MIATEITIDLPEQTRSYHPGSDPYPQPAQWLYLDVRGRAVEASSLPPGYSAGQRPDWMQRRDVIELVELAPNLASTAPLRGVLERHLADLADLAEATEADEVLEWDVVGEITEALRVAMGECPIRATWGEVIVSEVEEIADLIRFGSLDAYVEGWDAGNCVVDPAEIRDCIGDAVRERCEHPDDYDEEEVELAREALALI